LRIDDLVVFVSILINIVDHHFFEVGLRHLLKTSLKSELVIVTSSFAPKRLDSLFLLSFGHFAPIVGVTVIALVNISFGTTREQHLQKAWVRLTALLWCLVLLISICLSGTTFECYISGGIDLAHFNGATLM